MDIIGSGYLGFETAKIEEWRDYGPNIMGYQIGKSPESDPDSLYFRTDDRRHRLAFGGIGVLRNQVGGRVLAAARVVGRLGMPGAV